MIPETVLEKANDLLKKKNKQSVVIRYRGIPVGGIVREGGKGRAVLELRPVTLRSMLRKVRSAIALILFGKRYPGPHDYVSLRRRFCKHKGAYGWKRAYRIGRRTLVIGTDGFRLGTEKDTCRPYWNRSDWRFERDWKE